MNVKKIIDEINPVEQAKKEVEWKNKPITDLWYEMWKECRTIIIK